MGHDKILYGEPGSRNFDVVILLFVEMLFFNYSINESCQHDVEKSMPSEHSYLKAAYIKPVDKAQQPL